MRGKIALVTGGLGCIGTAVCQALTKQGAQVVAGYRKGGDEAVARVWEQEQKKLGFDITTSYVDVADFNSCAHFVRQIEERFGRVDIVVNNAGITRDRPLYKMTPAEWNDVMRTNLDSVFNVTRQALNGMIERRYGRIVSVSSINGQKGQFGQTNYGAAKAGIYGFTKSLALEVARKGITVNTVSPGYIDSPMVNAVDKDILGKIINEIPVGRLGKAEEIARAIAFLAAEESGFITGSNLVINGGQYLL